ncbi:hypothetical protein LCGC14_2808270, partial [marine sediment metagenome]
YTIRSGLLSQEAGQWMRSRNMAYVALSRLMVMSPDEAWDIRKTEMRPGNRRGIGVEFTPDWMHRAKGSAKFIKDPLDQLLYLTTRTIQESDYNNYKQQLFKWFVPTREMYASEVSGLAELARRVPYKLENIIERKDYKWTTNDVEIIKQAIKELDNFSSYYITEWIKILEPIINDILTKINFQVSFEINEKGNIDVNLLRNGEVYNYKDLSAGQRLVVSISFQLALLLENTQEGFIIADEGFSNLDIENLKLILELFKNLPFQLLCVIHRL